MIRKSLSLSLNEIVELAHGNACDKGWHDEPRKFGELLLLCHSELSEAAEEYRNGRRIGQIYYSENGKPEGIPIELADAIIRIADLCGYYGIDLEQAVAEKMEYNRKRSYRHGNKVI